MNESSDDATPKDQFLDSLNRCALDASFVPRFYDRFINSSDEVRHKFRFTALNKQQEKLLRSLRVSAAACDGDPQALREVAERSQTHDRHHLDIRPVLYDLWLDTLIITAREFDPKWNESIENAWRTVLGFIIKHMVTKY